MKIMKQLKYSLLIVGLLGILFSTYGLFVNVEWTSSLMGLICGACLIYGYFEVDKSSKAKTS
jgi:uncharacterized membrane protein